MVYDYPLKSKKTRLLKVCSKSCFCASEELGPEACSKSSLLGASVSALRGSLLEASPARSLLKRRLLYFGGACSKSRLLRFGGAWARSLLEIFLIRSLGFRTSGELARGLACSKPRLLRFERVLKKSRLLEVSLTRSLAFQASEKPEFFFFYSPHSHYLLFRRLL
jgi:hypothetical protein